MHPFAAVFPFATSTAMSTSSLHDYRPLASATTLPHDLTPATSPKPAPPRAPAKATLAQRWESFIRVRQEYSLSMVRPSFFAPAPEPSKPAPTPAAASPPPTSAKTRSARGTSAQGSGNSDMTSASKGKSKARLRRSS